jgi:hypothetical protein
MTRKATVSLALGLAAGLIVVAGMLVSFGQPEIGIATLAIGSASFLALSSERRKLVASPHCTRANTPR